MTTQVQPKPTNSWIKDFFNSFVQIFIQPRTLRNAYPGIMHLLIFWGMILLTIGHIILILQMDLFLPLALPFPRGNTYLAFETISDIAGLALLAGIAMALYRRLVIKPSWLESRWDDFFSLILLALIPLVGYFNGALRILATQPEWAAASPVENFLAGWLSSAGVSQIAANNAHQVTVYFHIAIGLILLASLPFTKMKHLIVTPANILTREKKPSGELDTIEDIENAEILGAGNIEEFDSHQLLSFDACLRCGRCEAVCPAAEVGMSYTPRVLIQTLKDYLNNTLVTPTNIKLNGSTPDIFGEDYAWNCTTCGACIAACPAYINPVDQIIQLRRYQVLTTGKMPSTVGETLRNMERQGNPWGLPPQERGKWSEGLSIPIPEPDNNTEILLYLGCAMAFDERNKKIARNIIDLFSYFGVNYTCLGPEESCCGETARRMGHEYVFQVMAEENIMLFKELGTKKVVTPCPHCFNTFKNEYPEFGAEFEVQHLSEFLSTIMENSQFKMPKNRSTATVHDPCYLGRINGVIKPVREVAEHTPFILVEMEKSKQNSFCCGGGGGQMWMETDSDKRINHERLEQALQTGTDTILTSCPYCLTMFEDAIGAKGLQGSIKVMDITEAVIPERNKL